MRFVALPKGDLRLRDIRFKREAGPCQVCKCDTFAWDVDYGVYVCSTECQAKIGQDVRCLSAQQEEIQ